MQKNVPRKQGNANVSWLKEKNRKEGAEMHKLYEEMISIWLLNIK